MSYACVTVYDIWFFFFSSRRRHTRCALVTGVQTCALPISGDELHREERMPVGGGVGIEHLGDRRVPHLRQQLALDLEIGQVPRNQIGRASCRERVCQYV